MSKKIFIVSSSPRTNGNSDLLANEFSRGAKEAGHAVEKCNVRDLNLKFCIGCLHCQSHGVCILNDGMNELYARVQNADILVFATPIYYYAVSGQLKTFLDRLNPLYSRINNFQEVYLLAAAAEADESAVDGAIEDVQHWIDCFAGVKLKGVVKGVGVSMPKEILRSPAFRQAYLMGKNVSITQQEE